MSYLLALVLGAATTGGATASMVSGYGGDLPRYAIVPGFWTVWFSPSMESEEADYAVYFGVNTAFWSVAWHRFPRLAGDTATALAADVLAGFVVRHRARE